MSEDLENAREVLSAYDELADDLRAENARLREALAALVNRLDEIHADPAYKSVWTVHQIHVGPYRGPTYVEALARAHEALDEATASA